MIKLIKSASIISALLLIGCGQSGPLYLPQDTTQQNKEVTK